MKKGRRILAGIGALLLVVMYALTLIFALIDSPLTNQLLMAAIACTIVVPVLLYAYQLVYKIMKPEPPEDKEKPTDK